MPDDDSIGWTGALYVYERDPERDLDRVAFAHGQGGDLVGRFGNVVTNQWFIDAFQLAEGTATISLLVSALALGNGALGGGPYRTDTGLVAETDRLAPIASTLNVADPPRATFSFFSPAAGAVTWTEAGLYIAGATTALGTGHCMSHAAFAYSKAANVDARIDYVVTRA